MVTGARDLDFGNPGTLWSSVPAGFPNLFDNNGTAFAHVGGTVTGMHYLGASDVPALVISTWRSSRSSTDPGLPPFGVTWLGSPGVLFLPADGAPQQAGLDTGTRHWPLAASGIWAEPVASCPGPGSSVCVLVRMTWSYVLRTVTSTGPLADRSVSRKWLYDPIAIPLTGNVASLWRAGPWPSSRLARRRSASRSHPRAPGR